MTFGIKLPQGDIYNSTSMLREMAFKNVRTMGLHLRFQYSELAFTVRLEYHEMAIKIRTPSAAF